MGGGAFAAAGFALDITSSAQDRAVPVLKTVRKEVDATTAAIEAAKKASADEAAVQQIFIRGQVAKRQALADANRERVLAARADRENATLTNAAADRLKSATKVQQTFNQVLGLGGFVGVIGAAAAGFVEFINEATGYQEGIRKAEAISADFVARLKEMKEANLAFAASTAGQSAQQQLDAAVKLGEAQSKQGILVSERVTKEQALKELFEEQNQILEIQRDNGFIGATLADRLKETREKIRNTGYEINQSLDAEKANMTTVSDLAYRAGPAFRGMAAYARELPASFALAAGNLTSLIELALKLGKEAPKPKGGDGGAARIRGLERELELARASNDNERDAISADAVRDDFFHKRISLREAELRIAIIQERTEDRIQKAAAETEKTRAKAIVETDNLIKSLSDKASAREDKRREEMPQEELNARVAKFQQWGDAARYAAAGLDAVSGGLGGLANAFGSISDIWGKFDAANDKVGSGVAATLGVLGQGIASAIKSKRVQAGVEGAFEEAAAIASFAAGDIPQGIGHQAAAAAFFAVAAGAGGGGRRSSAGGASAGSSGGGARDGHGHRVAGGDYGGAYNGPPNITIMAGAGSDPQAIVRALNGFYWQARGTGAATPGAY